MSGAEAGFHEGAEEAHTRQSGLNDGKSESQLRPHQPPIQCRECTSQRVWKDGVRSTRYGDVQRYICRSCGYRFSESKVKFNVTSKLAEMPNPRPNLLDRGVVDVELSVQKLGYDPPLSLGEDVGSHKVTTVGEDLNSLGSYNRNRRVRVSEGEAKNLAEVESRTEKRAAGATKPTSEEVKGKIVECAWWMKKQGYAETTIITRTGLLNTMIKRGADLWDPESVKEVISNQKWSEGRKLNAVYAYDSFLSMIGLSWEPPNYVPFKTFPSIPTEVEIDALIAGCGKKMAMILQLLKETAMRIGEARSLKWIDIDTVNRIIRLNSPEKNSNPRIFKVSEKLIAMINSLPKSSIKVFGNVARTTVNKNFYSQRKRLAIKLSNPRLLQISFHTLRHWKATTLYHQTKDILFVKEFLGHKNINSTLIYIQIERALFGRGVNDEFICKIAQTPEEVSQLIEAGFEYVTDMDNKKFFRKRK